jgi:L-asparaginase type I
MTSDETAKICLITTGGTISSIYDEHTQALRPGLAVDALLDRLPKGMGNIEVIKRELYQIVVSHGTDTMTYSSAAISFMIQDFGRPIVFTGSQIPASIPWSDGPRNLLDAMRVAAFGDLGETVIVFNGEIHRATRAKKVRVNSYDAFDSVDPSAIGLLAREIVLYEGRKKRNMALVPRFDTRLDDRVFLLKVFPGIPPQTLTKIMDMGYHGIVIEGFGSGNIPTDENALTGGILQAIDQGCFVVVSSQCAFGQADLSIYEVGRAAMDVGAMSAFDMTSEAALVKLAWVLGHTRDSDRVREMMSISYVGEMSYTESPGMNDK